LNSVAQQLEKEYPGNDQGMALRLTPPGLVDPNLRSAVLAFTGALMLTVVLVLMIACSNLASLLLARAAQRRKEIAVRMAIGATRFRLTRQLLTESLMLSVIGAALGLLFGTFLMRLAQASLPSADFALTLDLRRVRQPPGCRLNFEGRCPRWRPQSPLAQRPGRPAGRAVLRLADHRGTNRKKSEPYRGPRPRV
jgi:hypothetical protein